MYKPPRIFGIYAEPNGARWILAALPFVILVAGYAVTSEMMHAATPDEKLFPTFGQMANTMWRLATETNKGTGQILLWTDTVASLGRLLCGVYIAAAIGLVLGVNMAMFPGFRATFAPFITFLSIIPPLALISILLIALGVGEVSKVTLIFFGTVFVITRDIYLATLAIPIEQTVKALTLGATQLGVVYRVILPQIMPRLLSTVRLALGSAWLFLIAAEMIAASDGLGYRISLARRLQNMDVIYPYVLWITLLGFTLDMMLRTLTRWLYPWYTSESKQ